MTQSKIPIGLLVSGDDLLSDTRSGRSAALVGLQTGYCLALLSLVIDGCNVSGREGVGKVM